MDESEIEINSSVKDLNIYDYNIKTIDKINYEEITYDFFFTKYMLRNMPCIVKNVSMKWDCNKKWTKDGNIIYDYFIENYGDLEAPVADCEKVHFNAHTKIEMKVGTYMKYLANIEKDKLLYLKDWHLKRLRPDDNFYEVPFLFASDWLNEFAIDHDEDDFMFVYIGPKDTWTPLHADVFNSYSWSVNVVGRKKWLLFPPGEEEKLKDSLGNLPLFFDGDITLNNIKCFEIFQDQGDAIFVPSGWFHQVVNLLDTISINHNWINACNIELVWKALQNSLTLVENEIKELELTPEFPSQCQLILKSVFGMDVMTFINFICYISKKRVEQYSQGNKKSSGTKKNRLGSHHIKYDIKKLLNIINCIDINKISLFGKEDIKNDFIKTKHILSNINLT